MNTEVYRQIIDLQQERNNTERERYFEQLIREIMDWDTRPPVFTNTKQSAARPFNHAGNYYLVGMTASKIEFAPGVREWDDFEQQLRKKENEDAIGVFFSLFPISVAAMSAVKALNLADINTIVVSGSDWFNLFDYGIYFPTFLEILTLNSKIGKSDETISYEQISRSIEDNRMIEERYSSLTKRLSAPFLRRFKHKFHEKIFIERNVDKQIKKLAETVKPHYLRFKVRKDNARQVIMIRDFSGSGKTTLSVNLTSNTNFAYCLCVTANMTNLGKALPTFFSQLGYPEHGIKELLAINKPILFIIDSLDETPQVQQIEKRKEIKELLRFIDLLNEEAAILKLAMYPIMVAFTIREDYWRDWETVFEGQEALAEFRKLISSFNSTEFQHALERYEHAYDYSISHNLSPETVHILSVPINLEIFSEANHFEGDISVTDIWEGNIMSSFFDKKEQLIGKHAIPHFNVATFYRVMGEMAFELLKNKTTLLTRGQFNQLVRKVSPELAASDDKILQQLISEQIIINETEAFKGYRFKYNRFVEYIAAFFIVQEVQRTEDFGIIDDLLQIIYESNIISIFTVFSNLKHISKTRNNELHDDIVKYYAKSDTFLNKYLPELRGRIGRGEVLKSDDVKEIIANMYTPTPETSWHIFFIVATGRQRFNNDTIFSAFKLAWENNSGNYRRWQLIQKLAKTSLLLQEALLLILLQNGTIREWEEYLGQILEKEENHAFTELWLQYGGENAFRTLTHGNPSEWQVANHLLDLIINNEAFEPGVDLGTPVEQTYVTTVPGRVKRKILLPENERNFIDVFVYDINRYLKGATIHHAYMATKFNQLEKNGVQYLNQELEETINALYAPAEQPFINHILSHFSRDYGVVKVLLEIHVLHYDLHGKDRNGRTALMEIIEHSEHKVNFTELLFLRGYRPNKEDDSYFQGHLDNTAALSKQELENILLCYTYYKVRNPEDRLKISHVIKPILILYSFQFNRIISYNYNKMIQVVHLALENYAQYRRLFIRALEVYNLFDQMNSIDSFRRKIQTANAKRVEEDKQFDRLFETLFPILFT